LTSTFEENPFTEQSKILSQKTRVFVATNSEDFVIACTVLIEQQSVTDEQAD